MVIPTVTELITAPRSGGMDDWLLAVWLTLVLSLYATCLDRMDKDQKGA